MEASETRAPTERHKPAGPSGKKVLQSVCRRYEWTLSMWLRSDAPEALLAELRFHLGEGGDRPASCQFPYQYPIFAPTAGDAPPGGAIASLRRSFHARTRGSWT